MTKQDVSNALQALNNAKQAYDKNPTNENLHIWGAKVLEYQQTVESFYKSKES